MIRVEAGSYDYNEYFGTMWLLVDDDDNEVCRVYDDYGRGRARTIEDAQRLADLLNGVSPATAL